MGTGYTRQSAAEIQDGEDVLAGPLNAEFNAIVAALNGSSGHSHDGTSGEGPLLDLATSIVGVLKAENGGTGGIHKLNATVAPTVNDDSSDGYAVGSLWVDTVADTWFINVDATVGAAKWIGKDVLDLDLATIAALTGTGQLVRTADNAWVLRTLVGAAPVVVTNGNGVAGNPSITVDDATTGTNGLMTAADKTKLNAITSGATVNSTDAQLRDRATHTGVQAISTITDLTTQLANKLEAAAVPDIVLSTSVDAFDKATPVDTDYVTIVDSEASNIFKRLTFANVKVFLKTYFDTLYATVSHIHSNATTSVDGFMSATDKTKLDGVGTNGAGNRTISTSAPSGGSDGDIWYRVT